MPVPTSRSRKNERAFQREGIARSARAVKDSIKTALVLIRIS
jgi:hypothetical protein